MAHHRDAESVKNFFLVFIKTKGCVARRICLAGFEFALAFLRASASRP
jgi:hypothetical protein